MTNDKEDNVEDILNELGISSGGRGLNGEGGKELNKEHGDEHINDESKINEIIRPQERKPEFVEHEPEQDIHVHDETPEVETSNSKNHDVGPNKEKGATAEIESGENTAVAMLMEIDGNIVGAKGVFGPDGLQRTSKVAVLEKVPAKEKSKQISKDDIDKENDDRDGR